MIKEIASVFKQVLQEINLGDTINEVIDKDPYFLWTLNCFITGFAVTYAFMSGLYMSAIYVTILYLISMQSYFNYLKRNNLK